MERIELIASGYEWTCPRCDEFNEEIEVKEEVCCRKCGKEFEVLDHYHAYK